MSKSGFGLFKNSVLLTLVLLCIIYLITGVSALAEISNENSVNLTLGSLVHNETNPYIIVTNTTDLDLGGLYEFRGQMIEVRMTGPGLPPPNWIFNTNIIDLSQNTGL